MEITGRIVKKEFADRGITKEKVTCLTLKDSQKEHYFAMPGHLEELKEGVFVKVWSEGKVFVARELYEYKLQDDGSKLLVVSRKEWLLVNRYQIMGSV